MSLIHPAGEVALVTGGGGDIGRAIAAKLACMGCDVAVADISGRDAAVAADEIVANGYRAMAFQADLARMDEVERLREQVQKALGNVSIVVNAVGIVSAKKFLEIEPKEWERVLNVNLGAVYNVCKVFVPVMAEAGSGRIINIASAAGKTGGGLLGTAAYVASKAGVIGFTKALAREFAVHHITCNSIAPGPIDTRMTKSYREDEVLRRSVELMLPLRRIGHPEEVATAVAYLASVEAGYITGETFDVDGGLIME